MSPEEIYQLLEPRPFRPVRIHLKDGRFYDINHRELVIVGLSFLDIGIPAPNEPEPIFDYVVTVPLRDIQRVELLTASQPVSG